MLGSVNMVLYIWAVPRFEMKNKIGIIVLLEKRERWQRVSAQVCKKFLNQWSTILPAGFYFNNLNCCGNR